MRIFCSQFLKQLKPELYESLHIMANGNIQTITNKINFPIKSDDILFIWNRHLYQDHMACLFESVDAKVVVCENPYIKCNDDLKWYSFGLSYHNTQNHTLKYNEPRLDIFNISFAKWKKGGKHILYCTQAKKFDDESIGYQKFRQPYAYDTKILTILDRLNVPIVFRPHPNGKKTPNISNFKNVILSTNAIIEDDLEDSKSLITYSSNSITEGLINGTPCIAMTDHAILLKDLCGTNINDVKYPADRKKYFDILANNQYNNKEIEEGLILNYI